MPQESQYSHAHKQRQKTGEAKPKGDNNSMTVEGALDVSGPDFPKVPPKPAMQLPVDDAFAKFRTQQS